MIRFSCPHCAGAYELEDEFAGRKVRCMECQTALVAPEAGAENVSAVVFIEESVEDASAAVTGDMTPVTQGALPPSPPQRHSLLRPHSKPATAGSGRNWGLLALTVATVAALGVGIARFAPGWMSQIPGVHVSVSAAALPDAATTADARITMRFESSPVAQIPVSAAASVPADAPTFDAVLAMLAKDQGEFTPALRSTYLAFRKAQALSALASHGHTVSASLLDWVDSDPVIAATVYGIRHGTPAQALYLLRSLELDLGADKLKKYGQAAMAAVRLHAASIDLAAPASGSFSLRERPPLVVKIPPSPLVKADTHPKDRALDVNDHIINFLEEIESQDAAGKVSVKPRDPILTAGQVVASPKLQKEFNAYMASKVPGFKPIDCGDNLINKYTGVIWRHPYCARFQYASELFTKAYIAKGRLPAANDPHPTPTEWIAYQVSNAENPKRGVNLQQPWPMLMYVIGLTVPLREAEFVWDEKARGINPMRYIMYIGSIAQANVYLITLSRLQPFEFTYNSYPGKRHWGGVCGSHTHVAMVAGSTLGLPMINCSSPGHSFPGGFNCDKTGLWSLSAGNTGAHYHLGVGAPEGVGSDLAKLHSTCWALNCGLRELTDAQLAWTLETQLPPEARAKHGIPLLESALRLNPYNLGLIRAAQARIPTALEQVGFYQNLQKSLTIIGKKPGCPDANFRNEFETMLNTRLEQLPVPADKAAVATIADFLASRGGALWAKYQVAHIGMPRLQANLMADLKASVAGVRTTESVNLLAQRLAASGDCISDPAGKKAWATDALAVLRDREHYVPDPKKPAQLAVDPCLRAVYGVYALGVGLPAARAEVAGELAAGISQSRTLRGSEILAQKIQAVAERMPMPLPKKASAKALWAQELLGILRGREVFAPDPAKPTERVMDPCLAAIYNLDNSRQAERERLVKDYQAAVAANRGDATANTLALRTQTLRASISDKAELAAFDDSIMAALAGQHFYYPNMQVISVWKVDPVLPLLQHKASVDVLKAALKTTLANGQSPESGAALAEYLRFLWTPIRWAIPAQQALAQELLAALRGHELYAPNPQKPGELRFEALLTTIYHNWGRTPHGQGGIYTSPADQKACEEWLRKIFAAPRRSPDTSAAMKTYLECLAGRLPAPARKPWGEQLLPNVRGKEYLEVINPAGVKSLQPDPAAAYVYALAGQKFPPTPPPVKR